MIESKRNGNIIQTRFQKRMHGIICFVYRKLTGLSVGTIVGERIRIGRNVWVGYGTKIITANHNLYDPSKHDDYEEVILGDDVWIGANCVILPGVWLGNNTVVGAGSVVTKSFPEGHCVVAGNPAKKIRELK